MPFFVKMNSFVYRIELIFISTLLLISCHKEEKVVEPEIIFLDRNSVFCDTIMEMGANMKFVIKAESGEGVPITNLVVSSGENVFLDSGLYANSLIYELNIAKGIAESETWSFLVMNKSRKTKNISVTITLADSSEFNPVTTITGIRMGAQQSPIYGSFYSVVKDSLYNMFSACSNQHDIDIVFYYSTYESTLSSPNEADAPSVFSGSCGIAEWSVRNETRYFLTDLTQQDFNCITNDSILIASYNPVASTRKGKYASPGNVWSFRLMNGKLGLIYVNETVPGADGSILFSLKVQQ